MPVSASEAAAWLTGKPAYDTKWPECAGAGQCVEGQCVFRAGADSNGGPACCFERRSVKAADKQPDKLAASPESWKGRDWFCWR